MASPALSKSSLLSLPASTRQTIYMYLLSPHPEEHATTINYTLHWPWFENPSNTTFNGTTQIDLCRCPQRARQSNSPTEDHIYARHQCYGPEVRFGSGSDDLWVLGDEYARSGQINFPRPATEYELERRPCANLLSTCKSVYEEAVPLLYRGRNLLFLTGPCPRGRYQAYATQAFLSRLTPLARAHVQTVSLVMQSYEEDCDLRDVRIAYARLAAFLLSSVPAFRILCLNVWDERVRPTAALLGSLFERRGVRICVARDPVDGQVVECENVTELMVALAIGRGENDGQRPFAKQCMDVVPRREWNTDARRSEEEAQTKARQGHPVWEEVLEDAQNDESGQEQFVNTKEGEDGNTIQRNSELQTRSEVTKKCNMDTTLLERGNEQVDQGGSYEKVDEEEDDWSEGIPTPPSS